MKHEKYQSSVSVIIPSYNSSKTIVYTLEKLIKQKKDKYIEEIIVVDSSDDNSTKELLKRYEKNYKKIKYICSGIRVIPAIQRNIGAKNARGNILCFIDSDAYPAEDWIEKILITYTSGWTIGGGSYCVPEFQLKSKISLAQYYLEFNEFIDVGKPRIKKMVPTCNLFCEKALFTRIGGFPEIRASEDTLFCISARKNERIIFNPAIKVFHIFKEQKNKYFENQILLGKYIYAYRRYYFNKAYLKEKYFKILYPVFIMYKFIIILLRIIMSGKIHFKRYMYSLPLFCRGLNKWGFGFKQGIREYDMLVKNLSKKNIE